MAMGGGTVGGFCWVLGKNVGCCGKKCRHQYGLVLVGKKRNSKKKKGVTVLITVGQKKRTMIFNQLWGGKGGLWWWLVKERTLSRKSNVCMFGG